MYDEILALRAIRQFTDEPISPDETRRLLEALRWTGSSKNRQAWSWVVVTDTGQRDRLIECGDFMTPVKRAPMTIVLVQEESGYEFDTGRLAQNLMLAADAIGLASCPVTLHREELAAEVLGLPDGVRARYAVAVGHPESGAEPGRMGGREPLETLTHENRYGG